MTTNPEPPAPDASLEEPELPVPCEANNWSGYDPEHGYWLDAHPDEPATVKAWWQAQRQAQRWKAARQAAAEAKPPNTSGGPTKITPDLRTRVLAAAGLDPDWRGDTSAIEKWLDAGITPTAWSKPSGNAPPSTITSFRTKPSAASISRCSPTARRGAGGGGDGRVQIGPNSWQGPWNDW